MVFVMSISGTKLRQNIYSLLDQVLETGCALEIERKGKKLLIIPEEPVSRLSRLRKRPTIAGDAEDLVHSDWSGEWKP